MKEETLKFLGYHNQDIDDTLDKEIDDVILEVQGKAHFQYIYQYMDEFLPFLDNPVYKEFLKNTKGYLLVATTLGHEIDQTIKFYSLVNQTRGAIFDAASSAYLIMKADEYEQNLPYAKKTFRFCPGYEKTSLDDNETIIRILQADKKIGLMILDSKLMIPVKSMVGIIGIGKDNQKSCEDCVVKDCQYRKGGVRCY